MQPMSESLNLDILAYIKLEPEEQKKIILNIMRKDLVCLKQSFEPILSDVILNELMRGNSDGMWLEDSDDIATLGAKMVDLRRTIKALGLGLPQNLTTYPTDAFDEWLSFAESWRNIQAPLFLSLDTQEKIQKEYKIWKAGHDKKEMNISLPSASQTSKNLRL